MMMPTVSVIVPGFNASDSLKSSLSSLRSQDWPEDSLEIIYVDDASTDDSVEIASEWAHNIVQLKGSSQGPAAARNAGARESSGQILVFMDADIFAPSDTIRSLVKPLIEDEDLDAVFGSYDSEPLDTTLISQYRNLLHHLVHQTSRRNAATFWAGCGAIRRCSFETVGGFDVKRYRKAMIEDIELGHRMRKLKMKIRLQPSIQVKHLKKWTLFQMIRCDIFSRGIPWMRLLFQESRAPEELGDLNLKISGFLSVVLVWAGTILIPLALWFPKLLYGVCLAFGFVLSINFPTYKFFWNIRGVRFALMVIPLHLLYHLCNGASVIGGLLYRCFVDKPLPGLQSISTRIREQYWQHRRPRRGKNSS